MVNVLANKAIIEGEIQTNMVVVRDAEGVVKEYHHISTYQNEPSVTMFYNGLITADVDRNLVKLGVYIPDIVTEILKVGYKGPILLWKPVSLTELLVTADTEIRIL